MVLESKSTKNAVERLERVGIASSCNMVIADANSAVDMEWSAKDVQKLYADAKGRVFHTNHYLVDHPGVEDSKYLPDSFVRVDRVRELCDGIEPSVHNLLDVFKDEQGSPCSICRDTVDLNMPSSSIFNIIMDLKAREALVTVGKPVSPEETFTVNFERASADHISEAKATLTNGVSTPLGHVDS